MERNDKLSRTDLALSICWMGVDAGWMLKWNLLALAFIVPTLLLAALTFYYTERELDAMCVTAAMASWAVMSCAWFAGDVGWWAAGQAVATVCLAICVGTLLFVGARHKLARETARSALDRFRRLRLQRK